MPDVNMASHEWRTEECEQFVRLYWNHPCLYNTCTMGKDYKDKNKGVFRLDARRQFDGVIHHTLASRHMLIREFTQRNYNFSTIATLSI